jgi:hypothetical protein
MNTRDADLSPNPAPSRPHKAGIIVPLHRQAANWAQILSGIERQTRPADRIYAVVDRPRSEPKIDGPDGAVSAQAHIESVSASSPLRDRIEMLWIESPPEYMGRPPVDRKGEPFLAGHVRNVGLERALADGCDTFVLVDGDCVPEPGLLNAHLRWTTVPAPVMGIGRRRLEGLSWRDPRECSLSVKGMNLFRPEGAVLTMEQVVGSGMVVWTCNLALNRLAVERVRAFNARYYGRSEVFCSEFHGSWGGEDCFLAVESLYAGVFIVTIGAADAGVRHIDHPNHSSVDREGSDRFYAEQLAQLRRLVAVDPMSPEFILPCGHLPQGTGSGCVAI